MPPKAVPSDVDDAAVRAAVHAVGAELPGADYAAAIVTAPAALQQPLALALASS